MVELIGAAIQLATVTLGFIQSEQLLKYVRELKSLRDELNEEIAKGQESDDSLIEHLYAKISNTFTAFNQQVAVLQASKGGPITTSVVPPKQ